MATVQKGKNLMLSIGSTIYGFATDCNFTIDTETEEVSTQRYKLGVSAGQWKEYNTVANGWSADSSHLMSVDGADFKALFDAQAAGSPVTVVFGPVTDASGATAQQKGQTSYVVADTTAGFKYTGSAIITSLSVGAPVDGQATFQINLQGTGNLAVSAVGA